MIKILRSECPEVLQDSPTIGTHYNKKKVVIALWEMQHKKCCYCEQFIPEEGHLKAVEHFQPKSIFKGLRNDWNNLLLACSQCNGKKSNKFPVELTYESGEAKVVYLKTESNETILIIDPSNPDIDPEENMDFIVDDTEKDYGLIIAKDNNRLGHFTIETIGLHRKFYTDKRRKLLHVLLGHYEMLLRAKDSGDTPMLDKHKDIFNTMMSKRGELAAFVRSFAKYKKLDQNFYLHIPTGTET